MKRRVRKIANFFAFNVLFFALYLNFIHKDKSTLAPGQTSKQVKTAALTRTVIIENPEEYLEKKNAMNAGVAKQESEARKTKELAETPLKLSIN